MCRYAFHKYKHHFACFTCRKSFKRMDKDLVDALGDDHPAVCPQCRLLMVDMGLDFKPPKHDDVKAWRAAERLFEVGESFHSCGCGGPGYRPRDPARLKAYFEDRIREYAEQLGIWMAEKPANESRAAVRQEAIEMWRSRIARLEAAIAAPR